MPSLLEIKTACATYHRKTLADLTINGQDVGLLALNQVRRNAEMEHDFGFQRRLLTLPVDTITGGSLDDAVDAVTAVSYDIKTIVEMGTFDQWNNLIPCQWTTTEEGIERQREENPRWGIRYPSDGQYECLPIGQRRLTITNNQVFYWPKPATPSTMINVGIEAYCFDTDWAASTTTVVVTGTTGVTAFNDTYYQVGEYGGRTLWINSNPNTISGPVGNILRAIWYDGSDWVISTAADIGSVATMNYAYVLSNAASPAGLTFLVSGTVTGTPVTSAITSTVPATSSVWTTKGSQYLQWAATDELNRYFKTFVPRQEGNVASVADLVAAGLDAMIKWDVFKLEGFRRHGR